MWHQYWVSKTLDLCFIFFVYRKNNFSSSDGEKIRLEMVVFYVEDIQEIGWCYVYISLPFKKYISTIILLVEKKWDICLQVISNQ